MAQSRRCWAVLKHYPEALTATVFVAKTINVSRDVALLDGYNFPELRVRALN